MRNRRRIADALERIADVMEEQLDMVKERNLDAPWDASVLKAAADEVSPRDADWQEDPPDLFTES